MTKTYKVKVNLLDNSIDKIVYNDNNEEKSTDTIYFRKINIADLTEDETEKFYDVIDKIAVLKQQSIEKQQEKILSNPKLYEMAKEQLKKSEETIEELNKQKKEKENKSDNEIQEENEIEDFLATGVNLQTIGVSTKEVMKFVEPLFKKFVFLDDDCKVSANNSKIIRQLGNGFIKANYFLLTISAL